MRLAFKSLSADARYRWQITWRALTAIFGGYALATTSGILLAYVLPMEKVDAVTTGMLLSFSIYACAVMWAFSHRSLLKSIGGIWLLAGFLFAVILLLNFAGVAR